MTESDIKTITETRDGRKFAHAGFKFSPAAGGMYSWQKRIGDTTLQACDWDTESPFYLVGSLHDDGTSLVVNGECGVDEAIRHLITLRSVPRTDWESFAARDPEQFAFY